MIWKFLSPVEQQMQVWFLNEYSSYRLFISTYLNADETHRRYAQENMLQLSSSLRTAPNIQVSIKQFYWSHHVYINELHRRIWCASLPIFIIFSNLSFTLIGNLGLVVLVIGDFRLHNPMYYFLGVLSFSDACYSTVVTPKMLVNFLAKNKYFISWMCNTDVSCLYFWNHRVFSLGCNGLWSPCSHLQPSPVLNEHVT